MKITDYIIRGGENLNSSAHKTSSFPSDAEELFDLWHSKLGKDDEEKDPKKKQKDILLDEAIRIACDHADAAE